MKVTLERDELQRKHIISKNSPHFTTHFKGIFFGAVTATPILGTVYNGIRWHHLVKEKALFTVYRFPPMNMDIA